MGRATFGQHYETQPSLFGDMEPAPERTHRSAPSHNHGQQAICCAWCFATDVQTIRNADGIAYCVPCARAIQQDGHGPLLG